MLKILLISLFIAFVIGFIIFIASVIFAEYDEESCYQEKQSKSPITSLNHNGSCKGMTYGDKTNGYLDPSCVNCSHLSRHAKNSRKVVISWQPIALYSRTRHDYVLVTSGLIDGIRPAVAEQRLDGVWYGIDNTPIDFVPMYFFEYTQL